MLGGRSAECTQPSARARQRSLPSAPPSSSPRFLFTTSVIVVVFFGFIFSFICHNFMYLYSQPHCCSFSFIGTYCGPLLFALSLDPIFLFSFRFPFFHLSSVCFPALAHSLKHCSLSSQSFHSFSSLPPFPHPPLLFSLPSFSPSPPPLIFRCPPFSLPRTRSSFSLSDLFLLPLSLCPLSYAGQHLVCMQ